MAVQEDFRRFEIEQMNVAGVQDFQAVNDQKVIAGTYNKFGEALGSAWNGNWSQAWSHLNYAPSDEARAAVYDRLFPKLSKDAQRLELMLQSPIGTTASLGVRAAGGNQTWQDAALLGGSFGENAIGGALGLPRTVGPAQIRLASPPRGPSGPRLIPNPALEEALILAGNAKRVQIIGTVERAAQPSIEAILRLDPNARIGFRGSLTDGLKGEHKIDAKWNRVAFDGNVAYKLDNKTRRYEAYDGPQGFDVDFSIVSDKLAARLDAKYPRMKRFRDAALLEDGPLTLSIERLNGDLQNVPGMKRGLPQFRIFTEQEMARKSSPPYYFKAEGSW